MVGNTSADLSELAYHIVNLWTFWNRSHAQKGEAIRAIKPMIEFYFGADGADAIARTVVATLETIEQRSPLDDDAAKENQIEAVSAILQIQTVELVESHTKKHWTAIFSSTSSADSVPI